MHYRDMMADQLRRLRDRLKAPPPEPETEPALPEETPLKTKAPKGKKR